MHKVFEQIANKHIYIFLFIAIWFCIDTNFDNILALKQEINSKNLITSIRAILPIVLFLFFISNSFFKKQSFIIKQNSSFNLIIILFIFYFVLQLLGLILTENNIKNSYYVLISIISILAIIRSYNKNYIKIYYQISYFILGLLIFFYGMTTYKWFFFDTINLNFYGTFPVAYINIESFSSNVIRSSGIARSSMILIIPLVFLLLINKTKLIYLVPFIFLSSLIYLTQSRIVILFYIIFTVFVTFFYLNKLNLKIKIYKIFILLLVPIIFSNSIIFSKEIIRTTDFVELFNKFKYNISSNKDYSSEHLKILHDYKNLEHKFYTEKIIRPIEAKTFSSNRVTYWKKIISSSSRPIIGYGVLGDRFLINKNSSNAFVYSYASGGLVSVLILIIIFFRYTFFVIKFTLIDKIILNKNNIILLSSISTISFMMYRSIAEVSIAVFSIDFIIFITCVSICEKKLYKKNKSKFAKSFYKLFNK